MAPRQNHAALGHLVTPWQVIHLPGKRTLRTSAHSEQEPQAPPAQDGTALAALSPQKGIFQNSLISLISWLLRIFMSNLLTDLPSTRKHYKAEINNIPFAILVGSSPEFVQLFPFPQGFHYYHYSLNKVFMLLCSLLKLYKSTSRN